MLLDSRDLWHVSSNLLMENLLKKIFIFGILERRIIYNYTEYGDTPACIGEKLDLDSQPGILQGMAIRVVEFSSRGYKIRNIFA